MSTLSFRRMAKPAALLSAAGVAAAAAAATTVATGAAATVAAPRTVTATLITRLPGTLKPGTRVNRFTIGIRVFPTPGIGYALASLPEAQYPARTTDGGRTWRTAGPALHVNAAQ